MRSQCTHGTPAKRRNGGSSASRAPSRSDGPSARAAPLPPLRQVLALTGGPTRPRALLAAPAALARGRAGQGRVNSRGHLFTSHPWVHAPSDLLTTSMGSYAPPMPACSMRGARRAGRGPVRDHGSMIRARSVPSRDDAQALPRLLRARAGEPGEGASSVHVRGFMPSRRTPPSHEVGPGSRRDAWRSWSRRRA